jgi:hypothetical protein
MLSPQLSVTVIAHDVPHGFTGVQHSSLKQTCDPPQVAGHVVACPQPFVAVYAPQWVPHAAALFGVQQPPSAKQKFVVGVHAVRPPGPQLTSCPQLFVVCPHCIAPQAASVSSGWHAAASLPASHGPQSIGLPQLSSVSPQRAVHHPGSVSHTQKLSEPHT